MILKVHAQRGVTHDVTPQEEVAHVPAEHGRGAAFFDLDRTLMAGSSGLYWARAARGAGLLTRRRIARYGWENVKFRLRGSTDQATDRVRREVGEMISGQRVVDLQRLAPKVLAGVLPRLYPQMLEVAHAHQDAGRPVYICTAASQEMAEMLAHVLSFDGALGARSEVVDGRYTGRPAGPFTYREGKAVAMRELAAAEGIDLAASYAYSDSESDLPMLRAVGHPVVVNPDAELRPRRPRGGLGGHALRAARPAPEGRGGLRLRRARGHRRADGGGAQAMSLHELTDEQREIRDLARRFADEEIAPHAGGVGSRAHASRSEVFEHLGELGLMGVCVPEEHGGAGADFLSYVLVLEELSRADAGVGVTVAVHTSAGTLPLLTHGTPEQVGRMVPPLAQGHELAAFALTESGSGSDAGAMRTRADDGRGITRHQAVDHQRLARPQLPGLRPRSGARVGLRRAPRRARASAVTREEEKMGLNSSSTADLSFEDTPAELPGREGRRHAHRLADPRRRAHRHRRPGGGHRPGRARRGRGLRPGAPRLRAPDRRLRRHPAEARRHADRDRGRPRARVARRAAEGGRPAAHASRAPRPSSSPRASRATGPARRSRSSAATATPRSSRSSATTATRR